MEKPVRPYKNISEFRYQLHWCGAPEDLQWPCLKCRGRGCPDCEGTGNGTREAVLAEYRKAIALYEIEKQRWNELEAARRSALKKLTTKEIEALRELGI